MTPDEVALRNKVRAYIAQINGAVEPADIADDTMLLEGRIVDSLHVMDLVLFLETLRGGRPLEPKTMKGSSFASIDAIYRTFLAPIGESR